MRKIIAILMAVVVVLAISVTSFAAEDNGQFVDTAYNYAYEADTAIHHEVFSTYTVTVPTDIYSGMTGDIVIDMSDVATGYHINAYVTNMNNDGSIPLYYDRLDPTTQNGSVNLTVNGQVCDNGNKLVHQFYKNTDGDGTPTETATIGFNVVQSPVGAGTYDGVISFRFECVNY